MTQENALQKLEDVLSGSATVAAAVQSKVGLFTLIGFIASASLAWLFYSIESSLTWNIIKCGLVLLPALVVLSVWFTLGKVVEAPKQISQLNTKLSNEKGLVNNLQALGIKKPNSFRGLISTVRAIRNDEGLTGIAEGLGGIVLLSNPAYLLLAFVNVTILLLLIIVAPFILIF